MVNIHIPHEELAEKLSVAGFEVESIDDLSSLAKDVVVGFVEKKDRHPNASKLSVCKVNLGNNKIVQIVCGAKNVRSGIHVPVATIGCHLPAKGLEIKKTEIRGVTSEGMICSLEELGKVSESDGICVLEELINTVPKPGEPISGLIGLDETIIELAITANRPDGMSMIGIAKEVSAIIKSELLINTLEPTIIFEKYKNINLSTKSKIYSISLIEGLNENKKSDSIIQRRIESAGINSKNCIVDITNYVMLELGQPLHAFDADRLEEITQKVVDYESFDMREAKDGESFTDLLGVNHKLTKEVTLITCHNKAIAIAGVIGSKDSAVNTETKRIWLESAVFSPTTVRASSRSVGIRNESSSRYEKGVANELTLIAAERAINLLSKTMNCKLISSNYCSNNINTKLEIKLRKKRVQKLLGLVKNISENGNYMVDCKGSKIENDGEELFRELNEKEIESSLISLGCILKTINDGWIVEVPPLRKNDLTREIDLIEEIARVIGFDMFKVNLPDPLVPGRLNARQKTERNIRDILCCSGLQEVTTFSLVGKDPDQLNMVEIRNPLLVETSNLRTNLWEEHLRVCDRNLKSGKKGVWIYEIGKRYKMHDDGIQEEGILGGIICGENRLEKWNTNGKVKGLNYYEARGKLTQMFMRLKLNVEDRVMIDQDNILHPGKSANVILEGKVLGKFGQLHPSISDEKDLPKDTYIFEILIKPLIDAATRKNKLLVSFKEYNTKPFLERDISMILPRSSNSSKAIAIIKKEGKPLLETVELIDRYEGENLKSDECSLTFRMRYRDDNKNLTDTDIIPTLEKIRKVLANKLLADLRS